MSKNHENVSWQSKDKTWSIGFYNQTRHGNESDGFDPEWDVDYDFESFEFVSTGHATNEAARNSWHGPNPGTGETVPYTGKDAKEIANYERMALWFKNPELRIEAEKKEAAKQKREHVKKLKAAFDENNDFKGRRVNLTIKMDDQPWTRMGMTQTHTGNLSLEGDWLMLGKMKVKNMKTGRLNGKIHEIEFDRSSGGYSRW